VATDRDLASWMRRQLARNEWTAADLARRVGMSAGRISEWLSGKRQPNPASCLRIADAFNADPDYVLALAGHRIPPPEPQPDDPRTDLIAMLNRVQLTPDRLAGLEGTLRAWIELDRSAQTRDASNDV
jgi:transcriptional regulator with XRE-family HTH domain